VPPRDISASTRAVTLRFRRRPDDDGPIKHTGFVWKPGEFSYLIDPSDIKRSDDFLRVHARDGVGAIEVVVRDPQCNEMDRFMLPKWHSFAATALLRPDLDAWKQGNFPKIRWNSSIRCGLKKLTSPAVSIAWPQIRCAIVAMRLLGDETDIARGIS